MLTANACDMARWPQEKTSVNDHDDLRTRRILLDLGGKQSNRILQR